VDTLGLILVVVVHSAAVQDRDGARRVLRQLLGWFPPLLTVFADGRYAGRLEAFGARLGGWLLSVVRKTPGQRTFVALPRRWVVERTFAWLNRFRRLSKDYEEHTSNSETMIHLAMISVMLRRISPGVMTS
jgi:putative transposase